MGVSLYRRNASKVLAAIDPYWDPKYDEALVAACMPWDVQYELGATPGGSGWTLSMMTVRTAEIDVQVMQAILSPSNIRQVIILGAGLDARAWRLPWPIGTRVFEVDSGSVESTKISILGQMRLMATRTFVLADLAQPDGLSSGLKRAGEQL